ncbi:MAG TPA: hypothetical protein VGX96_04895 [Candidatus Elarobacter sp.]|jgi:hypothetical protein|nr:hypothetical protein [Candidatus Elarobacter sp.]
MHTDSRFDDLDLREEPAGTDHDRGSFAATKIGCTQYTFLCKGAPLTGGCCE